MAREVVSKSPLYTGGTVVGRDLVKCGGRDFDNRVALGVQVDLAADPAVGAYRPCSGFLLMLKFLEAFFGKHFEDRFGRTYPYTFSAPGTGSFVGISVAAHNYLRMFSTIGHVKHAYYLDIFTGPNASRTQDAEGHIMTDHRIAGPLIAGAQVQIACGNGSRRDAISDYVLLEFIAGLGAPTVLQVI